MADPEAVGDVGVDVVEGDRRRRLAGRCEEELDVTRVVNVRRRMRIPTAQPLVETVDLGEHGTPPGDKM